MAGQHLERALVLVVVGRDLGARSAQWWTSHLSLAPVAPGLGYLCRSHCRSRSVVFHGFPDDPESNGGHAAHHLADRWRALAVVDVLSAAGFLSQWSCSHIRVSGQDSNWPDPTPCPGLVLFLPGTGVRTPLSRSFRLLGDARLRFLRSGVLVPRWWAT